MPTPGEVTLLLQKAGGGDREAADLLYRLVEKDLRAIAARRKRRFEHPLEASTTVLVDDAFCRLVGNDPAAWPAGGRTQFFSYAANKIHDLLVDAARARGAEKRGGGRRQVDLADAGAAEADRPDFLLDLKHALGRLEAFAPDVSQAFRIYYFLGSTFDETAAILQVSATEAKRLCKKAQMWLQRELEDYRYEP